MGSCDFVDTALLTISRLLEVDVGITQGAAGDHIAADPDGQHRPSRTELFIQHGLGDVRVQVTHVQGGHGVAAGCSVHLPSPHYPKPRQEDFLQEPHRTKGALLGAGPGPRLTGGRVKLREAGVGSEIGAGRGVQGQLVRDCKTADKRLSKTIWPSLGVCNFQLSWSEAPN